MNKAHIDINWENYPSDETPLNESNLNKMDAAIGVIDDRVITLDTTKATKTEVATLVADVTFEESTGIITITKKNGSKITIDTQMEKIAINFVYNPTTQQIILTLIDGTKQYIDLSALITQYEFLDSDTVAFYIDKDGKVSAIVKEGSIEEKHLEPNYLAKIKVEVAKAESSQQAAAKSEANAKASENAAKASETAAKKSEDNAKASETAAAKSATAAAASESNAKVSETSASESSATATEKASSASQSADTAAEKADIATQKAAEIIGKAESAEESATKAQSYAVGGTGSREGEDSDNAKYYYQQAKDISEGLKGGLQPHGTVAFADLPALADVNAGWMYNISDEFTTTDDFKEGVGNVIPAGANIYKTSDGKWDVLAGTPVTGIKGAKEKSYRRGNVDLTAANIGAVAIDGDTAENTTAFSAASARENLKSGEKHSILFGKIAKCFADLKEVAFTGKIPWADVTGKPSTYAPSSHTHNYAGSASAGGIATSANLVYATSHPGSWFMNSQWDGAYFQTNFKNENNVLPMKVNMSGESDTASKCTGNVEYNSSIIVAGSADGPYFGCSASDSNAYGTVTSRVRGKYVRLYSTGSGGVYLGSSGSTAITSDENLKDLYAIDERYERLFHALTPVLYKYKNTGHRMHVGFGARAVEDALKASGLTTEEFAGVLIDKDVTITADEAQTEKDVHYDELYSLRYEEFITLNTYMIQKLWMRVDAAEKENAEMKEQIRSMQQDIEELKKARA